MDLEAQAKNAKIQAVNFFNDFKEVEKTANTALSNSISLQSELSTVQIDLKSLIESLQVNFDSGVQNIQNQINEVTNIIVQEQGIRKSETEALQEQVFAQEDQLQKNVKGKKTKKVAPDAFAGKMRQKLREKAEKNSGILGAGLGLGLGMGLMDGGSGNWFTNLLPENPFKNNDNKGDGNGENNNNTQFSEENPPEGLRRVLTGLVDFVMFGATDMDYRGDLFGGNEENTDGDNEEITEGINTYEEGEEKKFLGVGFSDLKETFDILTLKPIFDQVFPNNKGLLNMLNNKKENNKQIIETNESISGDLTTFTVDGKTYPRGLGLGYNPLPAEGGSTYGDPGNEVIDGGTTVIEGGTQVVDGGTVGNNRRGEVVAQTSFVKSASSPLVAINMSENNSIRELVVG